MERTLLRYSPINTTLVDSNNTPLYKISTPYKLSNRTTKIRKLSQDSSTVTLEGLAGNTEEGETPDVESEDEGSLGFIGKDDEIARIHWRRFTTSRLVYNGRIVNISDFLPWFGALGRVRKFRAPDGQTYKWIMGWTTSFLQTDDEENPKTVARLRQGNILKGKKSVLEVDASILHILDLVVITFAFVERKRRDIETD